jgi:site-specific DNA-methyltransferase (adenine-specific)
LALRAHQAGVGHLFEIFFEGRFGCARHISGPFLAVRRFATFPYNSTVDPTASHYLRIVLDAVFEKTNFRSEIVWKRTSSHGNVDRGYGDNTDRIFFYSKSDVFLWNQLFTEYSEKHIRTKFGAVDKEGRHYTTSDLRNPGVRPNLRYQYTASNGITYQPHPNGWAVSREVMEQYDREVRLYFPKVPNGRLRLVRYLDESKGHKLQTLWEDISPINSQAQERLGYPTQKPSRSNGTDYFSFEQSR